MPVSHDPIGFLIIIIQQSHDTFVAFSNMAYPALFINATISITFQCPNALTASTSLIHAL